MKIRVVGPAAPTQLRYATLIPSRVYRWVGKDAYVLKASGCLVALGLDGCVWTDTYFTNGDGRGVVFEAVEAELVVKT